MEQEEREREAERERQRAIAAKAAEGNTSSDETTSEDEETVCPIAWTHHMDTSCVHIMGAPHRHIIWVHTSHGHTTHTMQPKGAGGVADRLERLREMKEVALWVTGEACTTW